jgi:hypothetical protein
MLDPASIERLAEFPEQNDPLLNIALAEEGGGGVLLALARCDQLGAEALDVIAERVARERDVLTISDDTGTACAAALLEERLVGHPNAPRSVRDDLLGRHTDDAFFVLSAAAHAEATRRALEAAVAWPSVSPLHDRDWLLLLDAGARDVALLSSWAEGSELFREAAALLASDSVLLERLAGDLSRRVRRAVASNARAGALRKRLAASDPAAEVRTRAAMAPIDVMPNGREPSSRFASALGAMRDGGVLAGDVRRALLGAGSELDEEGALLAARHLPADELAVLIAQATAPEAEPFGPRTRGVGAGFGLRCASATNAGPEDALLTHEIVHLVTKRPNAESRLTGKARVAHWISDCLGRSQAIDAQSLAHDLGPGALASDRMVLGRWASEARASLASACSVDAASMPLAVVELCWRDRNVSDDAAIALSGRIAPAARSERELPEDELDLSPLARPLAVLERAVLAAIARGPVAPRAALAAIALDPRRCRYVLSAMPTWKGLLTGARLARVLRSHAGALSAASRLAAGAAPPGARAASVARWTDRKLIEAEAAIAIAVGDLTSAELVNRLYSGRLALSDGVTMAAGVEARVAIDGAEAFGSLLDFATSRRTKDAAALALWMLLEELDRVRAPSLIASAIDGLSAAGSVVAPPVCEALATLERRSPGRLESVHAQSPRGRATLASAIARAYRAFGGMRDE